MSLAHKSGKNFLFCAMFPTCNAHVTFFLQGYKQPTNRKIRISFCHQKFLTVSTRCHVAVCPGVAGTPVWYCVAPVHASVTVSDALVLYSPVVEWKVALVPRSVAIVTQSYCVTCVVRSCVWIKRWNCEHIWERTIANRIRTNPATAKSCVGWIPISAKILEMGIIPDTYVHNRTWTRVFKNLVDTILQLKLWYKKDPCTETFPRNATSRSDNSNSNQLNVSKQLRKKKTNVVFTPATLTKNFPLHW